MKKQVVLLLLISLSFVLISCGNDDSSSTDAQTPVAQQDVEVTESPAPTPLDNNEESLDVLTSDAFPESWIGQWVCIKSGQTVIEEGQSVEFFDYDNKFVVIDTDGRENNWWICYDATTGAFLFYKSNSFVEDGQRFTLEVVKHSDTEIILNHRSGDEVILEKK